MKQVDPEDGGAEVRVEIWVVSQLGDTLSGFGVVWITAGQGVGEWRKGQSRRRGEGSLVLGVAVLVEQSLKHGVVTCSDGFVDG